jgi:hypothetical protein
MTPRKGCAGGQRGRACAATFPVLSNPSVLRQPFEKRDDGQT